MHKSCLMIQVKHTPKNVHLHFSYKGVIILHGGICFITNLEFIDE